MKKYHQVMNIVNRRKLLRFFNILKNLNNFPLFTIFITRWYFFIVLKTDIKPSFIQCSPFMGTLQWFQPPLQPPLARINKAPRTRTRTQSICFVFYPAIMMPWRIYRLGATEFRGSFYIKYAPHSYWFPYNDVSNLFQGDTTKSLEYILFLPNCKCIGSWIFM